MDPKLSFKKITLPPPEILKQKMIGSGLQDFATSTDAHIAVGGRETILANIMMHLEISVTEYMKLPKNKDKGDDYSKTLRVKIYECIFTGSDEVIAYIKKMMHL
jgi:hypothetical protein